MSIGDGEWRLWREGEPFSQRFTATFSDDGNTITGRWEIAEDGTNYTTDFDLILRRVRPNKRLQPTKARCSRKKRRSRK